MIFMTRKIEEIEQEIYDIIMKNGMSLIEAWFLLMTMADDINADLHGVFA